MNSNSELLTLVYAAFNRRDIETVLEQMHPEVDWPDATRNIRLHGVDEVRAYWKLQWETINPQMEPVRISDDQSGRTVVEVHQVIRDLTGNVLFDRMVHHVYRIEDGLIRRMDIEDAETA